MAETQQLANGGYDNNSSSIDMGAVVDNGALDKVVTGPRGWPLADFTQQMRRWTENEDAVNRALTAEQAGILQNNTLYVVSFGVWDIWYLVDLGTKAAAPLIDQKIQVIMEQLDVLADQQSMVNETKVLMTLPLDISFLPGFHTTKGLAEEKAAVEIVRYWGSRLITACDKWERGTVHIFDINSFVVDLIRDWQFFAVGIVKTTNGLGKNEDPGWENVREPCITTSGSDGGKAKCVNPDKYLFW